MYWDQFGAKTFEQAKANFEANDACVAEALSYWVSQILSTDNSITPEKAIALTAAYVKSLFAAGKCNA